MGAGLLFSRSQEANVLPKLVQETVSGVPTKILQAAKTRSQLDLTERAGESREHTPLRNITTQAFIHKSSTNKKATKPDKPQMINATNRRPNPKPRDLGFKSKTRKSLKNFPPPATRSMSGDAQIWNKGHLLMFF